MLCNYARERLPMLPVQESGSLVVVQCMDLPTEAAAPFAASLHGGSRLTRVLLPLPYLLLYRVQLAQYSHA